MYHHILKRIQQNGYTMEQAIQLFEKIDQNCATQDELAEFEVLSRSMYYLCQQQLKLGSYLTSVASSPFELFEWFVFESYDRVIA